MDNKKIIVIGGSGLVGSRVLELFPKNYIFHTGSLDNGLDITKPDTMREIFSNDSSWVIHFAAKADVDGCERDRDLGENGQAYIINVKGTKNVVDLCKQYSKKLIYISTDFVFDGTKNKDEAYSEEDQPNPQNWYARTKFEGENLVLSGGLDSVVMRIAYPYRKEFQLKKDFVRVIIERLTNNLPIAAITDHIMTPTFIDDIAHAMRLLIENDARGIYHVVGSSRITPFDVCQIIADKFSFDKALITKTTREEFFADRAVRPFNLALKNDKITKLGIKMKTFEQGIDAIINNL